MRGAKISQNQKSDYSSLRATPEYKDFIAKCQSCDLEGSARWGGECASKAEPLQGTKSR